MALGMDIWLNLCVYVSDYHSLSVSVGLIGLNVDVLDFWDLRDDFGFKRVDCIDNVFNCPNRK